MDPRNGGDLQCSQEGMYPAPRRGARRGGRGADAAPVQVGGGDPQDPLRVPAGLYDEEEQGGARALLPEDLPTVVGTQILERGGRGWGCPSRGVRALPVGGRGTRWVPWGTPRT